MISADAVRLISRKDELRRMTGQSIGGDRAVDEQATSDV
ncbi:hypothetical protein SHJG_1128 [Streptomyces hygroscopicus subsp. jinggangensis 5008]|nr:hypothetical protein SHJG_1128 [Streptomyces hygroscopicus subsp. jinggangensis 5008]AGF60629.1 hypothetical protein SHJGH_0963 [Streptomyces hygroscopicus subsp. jinggangensis TL01]